MSEMIETGGPAFPCHPEIIPQKERDFAGMTLRDYFAARAMTACYAEYCAHANVQGYEEDWKMGVALDSYAMADAMLKARDHGAEGSENDRHVATFLLREALKSCLEYGAMTGADWVTDKARAALAKAGEPR